MRDCTTGQNNTSVGEESSLNMTTGDQNVAVGSGALMSCTTGNQNTCVGGGEQGNNNAAGQAITTGGNNTLIGRRAGCTITDGSNNVCLGQSAGRQLIFGGSQQLYIARDNDAAGNAACFIFGDSSGNLTQGNNSSTWTTTSDRRLKKDIVDNNVGLSIINQIRVRDFKWKQYSKNAETELFETPISSEDEIDLSTFNEGSTIHQVVANQGNTNTEIGIIAQELESILPNSIKIDETTNAKSLKSNDEIFWHLVNAVKELSAKVTALEAG